MWPEKAVRSWDWAVDLRARERGEETDWEPFDGYTEAEHSRSIHEIRGLVIAQAAEIEDLLRNLVRDYCPVGKRPAKALRVTAGRALKLAVSIVDEIDLSGNLASQIELLESVINRRNALVHATVFIGVDKSPSGLHVPVMSMVSSMDDGPTLWLDERDLELELERNYTVLEAAVDIWRAVTSHPQVVHLPHMRVFGGDYEPPF